MSYKKGTLLTEGKTKWIHEVVGDSGIVIVKYKNTITKHDDPTQTKEFDKKAEYSTTTTSRVFELLKSARIPVAYQEQISPTEFIAQRCNMTKTELIGRRYAVGSFTERHPTMKKKEGETPHRFHGIVTEFFLKTTRGKFTNLSGELVVDGLDYDKGEEDPIIINPYDDQWDLFHAKKPAQDPEANLGRQVWHGEVIGEVPIQQLEELLKNVFYLLEGAWASLGCRFIDIKIEVGTTESGQLVVADVIDNDSWRLRNAQWQELSKEAFRQNEKLSEVERKYEIVASLVQQFRIPQQGLILWRGSSKDTGIKVPDHVYDAIDVQEVTLSGHKSPNMCIKKLEEIMAQYPDGGVILVKAGMSNGLGPMTAARTPWPVIAVPASIKEFPQDVWSNIRMPSEVPLATICSEQNAVQFAVEILAQKNPLLYMKRQKQIEELDF